MTKYRKRNHINELYIFLLTSTTMKKIIRTVDRASEALYDGFITSVFGRRGAVIVFVLVMALVPFSSFANLFWIALGLQFVTSPDDMQMDMTSFYALSGLLLIVGIFAIWRDIVLMANQPVVDHKNPPAL